jgi:hypothetical protein
MADDPPPRPPAAPYWSLSRLRQLAMIVVFDLAGPLAAYSLLRSEGMSAVAALVTSGILPAMGIAIGAWADRRLDVIGVMVLAGLAVGTILGLISHSARLYLFEGALPICSRSRRGWRSWTRFRPGSPWSSPSWCRTPSPWRCRCRSGRWSTASTRRGRPSARPQQA